jgi:Mn-dependent DtxR family transcriptional regulator
MPDYLQGIRAAWCRRRYRTEEPTMFEYPEIPYDLHRERARQLRAEAFAAYFKRLVALFRSTEECPDCDKPIVIS